MKQPFIFRLIRIWHRFVLGRTARAIPVPRYAYQSLGSLAEVAHQIDSRLREYLPIGIAVEVRARTAYDVPPGTVRVVLETSR